MKRLHKTLEREHLERVVSHFKIDPFSDNRFDLFVIHLDGQALANRFGMEWLINTKPSG